MPRGGETLNLDGQIFELLKRIAALFISDPLVPAGFGLYLILFWLSIRLHSRFVASGRERMGHYIAGGLQNWLLAVTLTAPFWWDAVFGTKPINDVKERWWLELPLWPDTMVWWSAGLLLAMAGIAVAATAAQHLLRHKPSRLELMIYPRTTGETIIFTLFVSPTVGFCEEIVFRGVFFVSLLQTTHDVWLSVTVSSLLFGLIHAGYGLIHVVATTAMGLILALSVLHTYSLWPAIVAHTLYYMAVPFLTSLDELAKADADQQKELGADTLSK